MSRFKNPLFRNYDLYNVPGKHSPGTGVYHEKNKSVKEFLKKKKKKLRRNKIKLRAHFFNKIIISIYIMYVNHKSIFLII